MRGTGRAPRAGRTEDPEVERSGECQGLDGARALVWNTAHSKILTPPLSVQQCERGGPSQSNLTVCIRSLEETLEEHGPVSPLLACSGVVIETFFIIQKKKKINQINRIDGQSLNIGPQQTGWCPPTLGSAVCFTQRIRKTTQSSSWVRKTSAFLLCVSSAPHTGHSQHFWSPKMCISSHQTIHNPSGVSYNLTRFWHYLPGDGVRSHRWRTLSFKTAPRPTSDANWPHLRCQPQVQFATWASDQLATNRRFPRPPLQIRWIY